MKIKFNPNNCIECLNCMTIEKCRILIDMIRIGGPKIGQEECDKNQCSKCADICPTDALTLNKK